MKGRVVKRTLVAVVFATTLAGCGASAAQPAPTPSTVPLPTRPVATARPQPQPTRVVTVDREFKRFANGTCRALRAGNASAIISELPYYKYNNGVYYGNFGQGGGQTSDPSLVRTWMSTSHVSCQYTDTGKNAHGVMLTSGWSASGGAWALIETDIFGGHWKINDFTFGRRADLYRAMLTSSPVVSYRG